MIVSILLNATVLEKELQSLMDIRLTRRTLFPALILVIYAYYRFKSLDCTIQVDATEVQRYNVAPHTINVAGLSPEDIHYKGQ